MHGRSASVRSVFLLALAICNVMSAQVQTSSSSSSQSALPQRSASSHASSEQAESGQKLLVTVSDENGVAVGLARVELQPPPPALALRCETDFAGRCEFTNLSTQTYELRVEKIGFYAISQSGVQVGVIANVDVTLSHQQEAREVVNVAESAPAIDPAQVSTKEELTGAQIVDIPYPGAHDYRNALTFIPGVTPDAFGQAHVAGAETYQTFFCSMASTSPSPPTASWSCGPASSHSARSRSRRAASRRSLARVPAACSP